MQRSGAPVATASRSKSHHPARPASVTPCALPRWRKVDAAPAPAPAPNPPFSWWKKPDAAPAPAPAPTPYDKNGSPVQFFTTVGTAFMLYMALKGDMAEFKADIKANMAESKADMTASMTDFKSDIKASMTDFKSDFKASLADFKGDLGKTDERWLNVAQEGYSERRLVEL